MRQQWISAMAIALLAGSVPAMAQVEAASKSGRDPRYWPQPVMDEVPPVLPNLAGERRILIVSKTNGFRDDAQIRAANRTIAALVRARGWAAYVTENAAVMNRDRLSRFDAVVLSSTSGNIFTPDQRAAFRAWIERGGGVVLLHGAGGDGRYDWDWYRDTLLGALFIGHTSHPDQFQQGAIDVRDQTHPATRNLPRRWVREEEWYAFDRVPTGNDTRILATLDEASYRPPEDQRMGAVHPIVWTRCASRGRVFFSALGHKAATYDEPLHQGMIDGAIAWAARADGKGCDGGG
jgi:uncharacterized protein